MEFNRKSMSVYVSAVAAVCVHAQVIPAFDPEARCFWRGGTGYRSIASSEGVGLSVSFFHEMEASSVPHDMFGVAHADGIDEHGAVRVNFAFDTIEYRDGKFAPWHDEDVLISHVESFDVFQRSFTNFEGEYWNASYVSDERVGEDASERQGSWLLSSDTLEPESYVHASETQNVGGRASDQSHEPTCDGSFTLDALCAEAIPTTTSSA